MSVPDILRAGRVFKAYGAIRVLEDVSITVRRGEMHAVIGPNGAGKTTLFKVLSGEVPLDRGEVHFDGRQVEGIDGFRRVRAGIGRTFQVARVFGEKTVLENVVVAVEARRRQKRELSLFTWRVAPTAAVLAEAAAMLAQMGLTEQAAHQAGALAYGDRKRLELAMCLALAPTLLMLDEPMAGMSAADRGAATALIRRTASERGISVLLTEHDMDVVFALADRITVLNYGRTIASGPPDEVRASPLVREVYLGHEAQSAGA